MAKNNNVKDFVRDLADAIRSVKKSTDLIDPQNFRAELIALSTAEYNVESVINEDGATQTLVITHKDYVPPSTPSQTPSGTYKLSGAYSGSVASFTITNGQITNSTSGSGWVDDWGYPEPSLSLSGNNVIVAYDWNGYGSGTELDTTTLTYDTSTNSYTGQIYTQTTHAELIDVTFVSSN